jgi:hypothetical protein
MGWIVDVAVAGMSVVAMVVSGLTRMAWDAKPNRDEVVVMVQTANAQVAKDAREAREEMIDLIAEKISDAKVLTDEKIQRLKDTFEARLEAIRQGTEYTNRGIDDLKRLVSQQKWGNGSK